MKKTALFGVCFVLLCLLQACRQKETVVEPDPVMVEETARLEAIEREIPAPKDYTDTIFGIPLEMVYVEGGMFTMGGVPGRDGKIYGDEKPAHVVSLSSYYISRYPVTQALWEAVMGENPSEFQDNAMNPANNMCWDEANDFCGKLFLATGQPYALPTEAQWEYAARGGNRSRETIYSGSDILPLVSCYHQSEPCATGQYKPNELGVYDMSGGVWEWCRDWFGKFSADTVSNPKGSEKGFHKVLKGGSWGSLDRSCRITHRSGAATWTTSSSIGLRVVMLSSEKIKPTKD